MRRTLFAIIGSLALLAVQAATAPHLVFRNLNMSDGMSDNFVRSMQRDSYGLMWMLTMNSVDRYDGYRFRHYDLERDPNWKDGLHEVFETADSTLWITGGSHNYIYHSREDYFDSHVGAQLRKYGISDSVALMYADDQRNLWCMSATSATLYYYDYSRRTLTKIKIPEGEKVWDMTCRDHKVRMLTTAQGGSTSVWKIDVKTKAVIRMAQAPVRGNDRSHLYIDPQGRLWLFTINEEYLWRWSDERQQWDDVVRLAGLQGKMFVCFGDDGNGQVWIGTANHGVCVMSQQDETSFLQPGWNDPFTLIDNHIACFYHDNEDAVMWVGTSKQGVAYANLRQPPVRIIPMQGMEDVRCLLANSKGELWMGFDSQGIGVVSRGDAAFGYQDIKHFTSETMKLLPSNQIICTFIDSKGHQWWGSYGGALCHTTDCKTMHRIEDRRLDFVISIAEDRHGRIWVATFFEGLYAINLETMQVEAFTTENSILNTNSLTDLCLGSGNTLYIGTSTGLYALDTETKVMTCMMKEDIRTLFMDRDGTLWVGLQTGLLALDIRNDGKREDTARRTKITTTEGLAHNCICGIIQDRMGHLWVSTMDGVTKIIRCDGQYQCITYKSYDGIGSAPFNLHAITCLPGGDILIGTLGSIVRITPTENNTITTAKMPQFTALSVGNVSIPLSKDITLRYNDVNISISVTSADYANLNKQRYVWRLNGAREWTVVSGNIITFNTLSPGSYTLEVKIAETIPGTTNPAAQLHITVTPPWWRSWWAYVGYVLLLLAVLAFVIQHYRLQYMHRMERQQREMEKQQREKERQQQHEMDEAKMRFFTNVSHDMRTPLSLIVTPLQRLLKGQLDNGMRMQLELIYRSAETLKDEITQLLDFRKLDETIDMPLLQVGTLNDVVSKVCDNYRGMELPGGVSLSLHLSDEPLHMRLDAKKMRRVVLNLVSNAIKYNRPGGTVTVSTRREKDGEGHDVAIIEVADTGIGVSRENRERIFERFFQEQHNETTYKGSGIGLHLVKQYVNMHGGTIVVSDNKPQGTVFTVRLPMENEETKEKSEKLPADATSAVGKAANSQQSNTLLIVEDNNDFRSFLQSCLIDHYNVVMAANGQEALQQLEQHEVSLIISDVMMPVMDGITLCQKVKTDLRFSHIPFMMLTARTAEEHQLEGLQEGADDYLTKPFNLDILLLRIDRMLKWSREAGERFHNMDVKPSEITVSHVDEELIKRAIALVEKNIYDSEYSVEKFSEDMGISYSSLYNKLMAITSLSPLQFMRTLRIKRGRQLLEQGGENVSQVAYQIGLSPKQFAKYFKEEYGMLPSELLKGK
ncbi:MAG: ATP-binding protein [Prevotella sp.]